MSAADDLEKYLNAAVTLELHSLVGKPVFVCWALTPLTADDRSPHVMCFGTLMVAGDDDQLFRVGTPEADVGTESGAVFYARDVYAMAHEPNTEHPILYLTAPHQLVHDLLHNPESKLGDVLHDFKKLFGIAGTPDSAGSSSEPSSFGDALHKHVQSKRSERDPGLN